MTGSRFVLALLATLFATQCLAQDYPARPVKIIVPFGAGGPADVYARFSRPASCRRPSSSPS